MRRLLAAGAAALGALPRPIAGLAALAWMGLIWKLSSGPLSLPTGPAWDLATNFAHAPFFGVLAVLAARAIDPSGGEPSRRSRLLGFAIAIAWGITDEWHQARVPGRSASALDLLTDATGAGVALWLLAGARSLDEEGARRRVALGLVAALLAAALSTFVG